jgi:DUF971 family protein
MSVMELLFHDWGVEINLAIMEGLFKPADVREGDGALKTGCLPFISTQSGEKEIGMNRHDEAWPNELKVSGDRKVLTVGFADGRSFALPAELLRVRSPSAEVQGHGPGQRVTVAGKRLVTIADLRPVGNYAVRIVFDDGHDTGLFTWRFFSEIGENEDAAWAEYQAELDEKGLSRDR